MGLPESPKNPVDSNDSGCLQEMAGSVFKTAALNHSAILPLKPVLCQIAQSSSSAARLAAAELGTAIA
jgi:hypothetical protein